MSTQNILYHDGCNICLDTAATFSKVMTLDIVDLSIETERAGEALDAGVTLLPSIVIDGVVFTLNPHSEI